MEDGINVSECEYYLLLIQSSILNWGMWSSQYLIIYMGHLLCAQHGIW